MNVVIGLIGLIIRLAALLKATLLLRCSKNYRIILFIGLITACAIYPIFSIASAAWSTSFTPDIPAYLLTSILIFASVYVLEYYVKRYTQSNQDLARRITVFDEFINSSPVLYFIISNEKIVYCNPATVVVSGYSEDELFHGAYNQIIHTEDRDYLDTILLQSDEDNTATQKTIRLKTKLGHTRWLHATFTTVSYDKKPAIAASAQDITQQVKTEKILQKAEERLRLAVESTELVVWDCDPIKDCIKIESAPSTFPVKNYSEYFSFKSFLNHVDPRDRQKALSTFQSIKNQDTRFEIDFRVKVVGKKSEWWHMEGRSYAESHGQRARIVGTSRCIQAHMQDREVIEKKEAVIRFQADLLANIGQMVLAQNASGEIVYWNDEAKKLFSNLKDASLPFDPKDLLPPQYRIIHNEGIMQTLRAGKHWSGEKEAYLPAGKLLPLHLSISPLTNKSGEFDGFIIVGTDLTEYKKIQAELKSSQEQLQVQMHRLQAIYTMAEVMKEAENLNSIYKAAADGISLVSDVDRIAILMLNEDKKLTFTYSQDLPEYYQAILLQHCDWVNNSHAENDVYVSDVQASSSCNKLAQSFADEGISSLAAFPLSHQHELIGKVITFWDNPIALVPVKTQIMRRIADQLAMAIVKKRAEIQLKDRTHELQTIADNIPDRIVRLDNNYNLLFANKATYAYPIFSEAGFSEAVPSFHNGKISSLWKKKLNTVFKKGVMQEFEFVYEENETGLPRHFQATVVPEKKQDNTQTISPESVVGIIRDITENRELQKLILDINARQQRKIGQDLHDELGQLLTGIGFLVEGLKRDFKTQNHSHAELASISELVEKSIAQTRILAEGLNPVTLELHGLPTSLQRLTLHTEKLYNIPCTFCSNCHSESLDEETAYQAYRIAQEAITNSVKHGQPSLISVSLHKNANNLVLKVIDDGIGLKHGMQRTGGQGLQIMRYRTRMINGELSINPRDSGGTSVTCIIPLETELPK